ncbi:MAG: amino acid adenylation domain-containing protein [Pyrinomonadaceae bacterium]
MSLNYIEEDQQTVGNALDARVEDSYAFPASYAQQRLWFLYHLQPNNPYYNVPAAIRLAGRLDLPAFTRALNEIIKRHEAWRTTFQAIDGQPMQVVAPTLKLSLPLVDLQELSAHQREAEVQRLALEEAHILFNLERGPLLRTRLLRLAPDEHILLLTMHHIVGDGWSIGIFSREVAALYEAFSQGQPSPLAALPIQYADFTLWQREWLQGEKIQQQLAYWKHQLGGHLARLQLPTDRPRPPVQAFRGARHQLLFPQALTVAVKALSRQTGTSLFMTLLAVFTILLHRYTGQVDLMIGSPIANRNRKEIEGLIGFFVNTLALRTDLSGNPTVLELLGRVREITLEAYAHQDLPFEKLVEELQPERDLSRSPLFDVVFVLQKARAATMQMGELALNQVEFDGGMSRFDLECHLWEESGQLAGVFVYSKDLFDAATIARMAAHFQTLLTSAVAHPEQCLSELPMLSEPERQQLAVEWSSTLRDHPAETCVHELFAAHATTSPGAVALRCGNESLTYRELDHRSNQLAHRLRHLGVGAEVIVAICMERSLEMVVGMLATLKAGGAYVPLDPALPSQRLTFMLEDSGASVLLTQEKLAGKLAPGHAHVIRLDRDWASISSQPESPVKSGAIPANIAFVIYTSGSTGRPKGALLTHQGLSNLVSWHRRAFAITAADRATQLAGSSFDASVWELWPYLASGASLHIIDDQTRISPELLRDQIVSQAITVTFSPTPMAELLMSLDWPAETRLRTLVMGGERLHLYAARTLPFAVFNNYGPTEDTVVTTSALVPVESGAEALAPPIGRPIDNHQVYLLSPFFHLVPVGVTGELCIGGIGLARGYRNHPELTAEKFIPDPFGDAPGARLYRTGDIARYLPGGALEFIGRTDEQVKIRGFRIELGEIEAVLSEHPAIRRAAVLVKKGSARDQSLVAYIEPDPHFQQLEERETEWSDQHVKHWQKLYEETYQQTAPAGCEPRFDISGWNSSYTGQPIPAEEMKEWCERTVEQLSSLGAERVLEIGCGTGLLLFGLAAHCRQYVATDFSQVALEKIEARLTPEEFSRVTLSHRMADDFTGFSGAGFDAVILNSVSQYFPNVDYLSKVLEGAVETVRPGGFIFIGDVRNLDLLETFHTSVQLEQSAASLPKAEFRQRVRWHIDREAELLLSPAFFAALKQHDPRITHVQIQLKRGRARNELTRFRYNVVLHIGGEPPLSPSPSEWLDWGKDSLTLQAVRKLLESATERLVITGTPNSRLWAEVRASHWLARPGGAETLGAARRELSITGDSGLDPEDFRELGESLGYTVETGWSATGGAGAFDTSFVRRNGTAPDGLSRMVALPLPSSVSPTRDQQMVANNPLHARMVRQLVPELRSYLAGKLPEHMVPAAFLVLKQLPLTTNGKIDRRALPAPELAQPVVDTAFVPPGNDVERLIAAIWQDVLQLSKLGVNDNFFDLGGHSLLTIQVRSKLREALNRDVPIVELFAHPTISSLALFLNQGEAEKPVFEQSLSRSQMRQQNTQSRRMFRKKQAATRRVEGDA